VGLNKPVVSAVNGVAAGAGANIALACDIVVAHEKASFIQVFSAIGLVPDSGGSYFLPRLVGRARAMAYAMLGDKISAARAEKEGMIYRCLEDENFESEVEKLLSRLAGMPTKALHLTKELINNSYSNNVDEQLALEAENQIAAANSEDYNEGVAAFLEKRKPEFKGR
jgi:2-(1,2-epoxy-1,2-dihydrophenyl)acetyl-CoA isomerase